jgi:hypothetical protein
VALTGASLTGPNALSGAAQDAILDAMAATLTTGGSTVSRTGVQLQATPPMPTPRACGLFPLTVPAGAARAVSLRALDSIGAADDDVIVLGCQ